MTKVSVGIDLYDYMALEFSEANSVFLETTLRQISFLMAGADYIGMLLFVD